MGANSKIEWTDHTFNPWWGCVKVSPGCQHCYAETLSNRFGKGVWGPNKPRRFFGDKHWREPYRWNEQAKAEGAHKRVFCASMADVFEDRRDLDPQRERLYRVIEETDWLIWLLLTKRVESIEKLLPERWGAWHSGMPKNVWLGFSAENQASFDSRWPVVESLAHRWHPAKIFVSAEPLLCPVDLSTALREENVGDEDASYWTVAVDWVIVGGESGGKARPMHPSWARSIRDQCAEAGVAFHFKQWGEWAPAGEWYDTTHCVLFNRKTGAQSPVVGGWGKWSDSDDWACMRRFGKLKSGRELDGCTHDEMPQLSAS
ncbi:MAG TPA: phage Gp37/Gp68 family protein [Anaerolineae bacterium]|nr:phage Gp37/Gp68 family protein [Anaerolineae bacterium]